MRGARYQGYGSRRRKLTQSPRISLSMRQQLRSTLAVPLTITNPKGDFDA
jgi:hypothetical protein